MVVHGLEETKRETGNWYFRLQEISFSKNSDRASIKHCGIENRFWVVF